MRHYVTGSSGFIGQHVCRYLEKTGHEVIPVFRPVKDLKLSKTQAPFQFVHLSAYGNHHHQKDRNQIIEANLNDLLHIVDLLVGNTACEKFYNVSTSAIQLKQQSLYSASKMFGEQMVRSFGDQRFVNVRPFSVFGPGESEMRFIPTVIRCIKNRQIMQLDPYAEHDWIYVEDFVDAMFKGYTMIGKGYSESNLAVVESLENLTGIRLTYQVSSKMRDYDDTGGNWYSPQPAPGRSLDEGLKLTYEHYSRKN